MSYSYLKHLNVSLHNLCTSLGCLVSSHLNINLNFQQKVQLVKSLVGDERKTEIDINELESQLLHLNSMLDFKIQGADEISVIFSKECKNVIELNNEYFQKLKDDQHQNDSDSDIGSLSGDGKINCKSNVAEDIFLDSNGFNEPVTVKKKTKLRFETASKVNPLYGHQNGPQLRKKLCLNLKTKPRKSKGLIQFKSTTLFKANKDANRLRTVNCISRTSVPDLKSFSYSKKCRRLTMINGVYTKRNKTRPKRSSWDNDDTEVYCICKRPSYGGMIACDNEDCKIEWFHYKCVDITTTPKGNWYCPFCKDIL